MKRICPRCGAAKVGLEDHLRDVHGEIPPRAPASPRVWPSRETEKREVPSVEDLLGGLRKGPTLTCADCGALMTLREGQYGPFYRCVRHPACDGIHGAYRNGTPLGKPADAETRRARVVTHALFDRLWKPGPFQVFDSRSEAYEWLQALMGLTPDEAHIGSFDRETCERLVDAVRDVDPRP